MASSSRTSRINKFCKTCKVYGAYHDSRHCKIKKEFSPPSTVPKVPKSEPQEVGPNLLLHTFQIKTEYASKPEISVEELPPVTTEDPAFWFEVCSFYELSQDSDYTPFEDEFYQDEINAIQKNK
ncbi:hypothetical protein L1987_01796 [Smallanthus sonchifolius]|uniref:Uncharacterized protein n=1 Tax=Smallanthus sonchifolius TaxID=185202 RepID=A0ACB9K643_9ASTR|nr:hypothetical protein L1987_01796 [Smallanthus sonchifolius]